jgi:hypothetical protein
MQGVSAQQWTRPTSQCDTCDTSTCKLLHAMQPRQTGGPPSLPLWPLCLFSGDACQAGGLSLLSPFLSPLSTTPKQLPVLKPALDCPCLLITTHLEDCSEEVSVPVLILAPVLKVLKQRVQLVVRVALQVPAGRVDTTHHQVGDQCLCQPHLHHQRQLDKACATYCVHVSLCRKIKCTVQYQSARLTLKQCCSAAAPVDTDVAPVANLLRQVCGVEDELGLEEGVLPVAATAAAAPAGTNPSATTTLNHQQQPALTAPMLIVNNLLELTAPPGSIQPLAASCLSQHTASH